MIGGTRVLVVNLAAITGLLRWPFNDQTRIFISEHRLPPDTRFVKVLELMPDLCRVKLLLISTAWQGHSDVPLPNPVFKYETPENQIVIPDMLQRVLGRKG